MRGIWHSPCFSVCNKLNQMPDRTAQCAQHCECQPQHLRSRRSVPNSNAPQQACPRFTQQNNLLLVGISAHTMVHGTVSCPGFQGWNGIVVGVVICSSNLRPAQKPTLILAV